MDEAALDAWNLAGGLEWPALPIVAAILGVDDIEGMVRRMVVIRNGLRARKDD